MQHPGRIGRIPDEHQIGRLRDPLHIQPEPVLRPEQHPLRHHPRGSKRGLGFGELRMDHRGMPVPQPAGDEGERLRHPGNGQHAIRSGPVPGGEHLDGLPRPRIGGQLHGPELRQQPLRRGRQTDVHGQVLNAIREFRIAVVVQVEVPRGSHTARHDSRACGGVRPVAVNRLGEPLGQLGMPGPVNVKIGGVHVAPGPAVGPGTVGGLPLPAGFAAGRELGRGAVELVPGDLLPGPRVETVPGRRGSPVSEGQARTHGRHPGNRTDHAGGVDATGQVQHSCTLRHHRSPGGNEVRDLLPQIGP